jgi:CheY-like chemotaxis protein
VRDQETARLALEASLTGHLVLSTLHTNSAPAAITRLVDMGVEPYLVASSLSLVVAQRLVRRVCEECAAPYTPAARILKLLGIEAADLDAASPRRGAGCAECGNTGYRGRLGVFEVLPVTASMRAVLMTNPNEGAVAAAARASGMQTLRSSALVKAHAGITTYEEVLRVTHLDSGSTALHCTACSGALASDMVICPWCATPVDRGHCEECDRPLDPAWRVCPWCRTAAPGWAGPAPVEKAAAHTPRLLVVEDDESVRSYVAASLTGVVEVVGVATASEALDLATTGGYDGIVVDHALPDLTGVEMIRLLRTEARTAAIPVLMLTGSDNADLETEARNAGADDYLTKPVEPALLEERVLTLVQRSARVAG